MTEELVSDKSIVCILGSYSSSSTLTIAEVCRDNKTPLICATASVDEITSQGNEWVFRIGAPSRYYSISTIDFLIKNYPVKTMGILHPDSLFANQTVEYLNYYAKEKGIEVLINQPYGQGMIDFKPALKKIKEKNPELLYMIAYTEDAPLMIKQTKEVDLNPKVYIGTGSGFSQYELITEGKEDAEYVIVASLWHKNTTIPGNMEFTEKYKEKFGSEPTYHSAIAYTSLIILADALERAESESRTDIRKAIKETNVYTIMGRVRFQDYDGFTNQNKHEVILSQIQKGEVVPFSPELFKTGNSILPVPPWSKR